MVQRRGWTRIKRSRDEMAASPAYWPGGDQASIKPGLHPLSRDSQ